jgi:peptidoglycan hydrolase-like protein with peptidoglycan-binding domain
MKIKSIATAALLASVALSPVSPLTAPARADGKDFIAGAIIGGIVGSVVTNENNKKKSAKSTKAGSGAKTSGVSAETRAANVEVQTALNYFGYNVGAADGAIGPKTRAQIEEYQAFLGFPATGELTETERTILITAYHRAVAGGPVIAEAVAGSPYGLKAVLITQRDEMAGLPSSTLAGATGPVEPGSVAAAAAAALPTLVPQEPVDEAAVEPVIEPEVETVAAEPAAPALPSFIGAAGANGSLATACAGIGQTTAANGGITQAETMQDASFALAEQFCLARDFAIAEGDALMAQIAGFTPEQIAEQCAAFGPALKEHVAALSLKPAEEVLTGVEGFILASGMSPAQLSGTAKVCLGVAYGQDDMEVAIGSALLLAAMGQTGYAEFLGHHLSQGFGATERADLAMGWYQMSLEAMEGGQMVVAPDVEGREAVIRKAAYTITGRADELAPEADVQEVSLPVFEVAPIVEPVEEAAVAPVEEAPAPVVAAPVAEIVLVEPSPASPVAEVAVAEPVLAPVPEVVAKAPAEVPVFVAPEVADLALTPAPQSLAEAAPAPTAAPFAADTGLMTVGAQAAVMAARLPLMVFSGF